nr:DegT/DnrJ/EryC1/StrS family aminotransferase [Clostridiales bacterium]
NVDPEKICIALNKEYNIEARPAWKPMHMQPVFKGSKAFSHYDDRFFCEELYKYGICLPGGDALTHEQQKYITDSLLKLIGE